MKNKLFKLTLTAIAGLLSLPTFTGCKLFGKEDEPVEEVKIGQQIVSYITETATFDVAGTGAISIESHKIDIDLDAQISIPYFNKIEIGGDVDLNIDGETVETTITYISNMITIHAFNNYIKAEADDIGKFIELVQAGLRDGAEESKIAFVNPSIKGDFSWNGLINQIISLTHSDLKRYDDGTLYYPIDVSGIEIGIKVDTADRFLGARLEKQTIDTVEAYADITFTPIAKDQYTLQDPLKQEDADKYINFKYAFNLWDGIKALVNKDNITANISVNVKKNVSNELQSLFSLSCNAGYSFEDNNVVLDATLTKNGKQHKVFGEYLDETVYLNVNSIAVCMKTSTINDLLNYINGKSNEPALPVLLDTLSLTLGSSGLAELIAKIKSSLGTIKLSENFLAVSIDLSSFDSKLGQIDLKVAFDEDGISTVLIPSFSYDIYQFDNIIIEFRDLELPIINKEEYQSLDNVVSYTEAIEKLVNTTKFSLEVNASLTTKSGKTEALLSSGIELNLDEEFAFGNINVTDGTGYEHKIKADVDFDGDILFIYNEELKGRFNLTTLDEIGEVDLDDIEVGDSEDVKESVDDLQKMLNAIMSLIGGIENPIIYDIANGDYLSLLDYDIIKNLQTNSNKVSLIVDSAALNLGNGQIGLELTFTGSDKLEVSSLKISDLVIEGSTLDLEVKLKAYDSTKEANRLTNDGTYLDFTSLKTLLDFGISTTKFTYYAFDGYLRIYVLDDLIHESIYFNGAIKIVDGVLSFEINFDEVPIILGVNPGFSSGFGSGADYAKNRYSHIYFDGEYFYTYRKDQFYVCPTTFYTRKTTADFFGENLVYLLLQDMLWLNGSYLNDWGVPYPDYTDSGSPGGSGSSNIKYERILQGYNYQQTNNIDKFAVDLDMNELLCSDTFSENVAITIEADNQTHVLKSLNASSKLDISVDNRVELTLNLNTAIMGTDANKLTSFESFKASEFYNMSGQIINHYYRRCNGSWQDRTTEMGE